MARTQVLLADVPELVDSLLRQALAHTDVDLLPRGASTEELRFVSEHAPPPVVIVMADSPEATDFERGLLRPHPDAVVIRVEEDGRLLAARSVVVDRTVMATDFTAAELIRAIRGAPTWRQRFA